MFYPRRTSFQGQARGGLGLDKQPTLYPSYVRYDGSMGGIMVNGEYNPTQWYCARMSVMRVLYNQANSAVTHNGITDTEINITLNADQGLTSINQYLLTDKYADGGYSVDAYSIKSGTLPEGLSISNGYITGLVLGGDSGTLVLSVYVDGWIELTVNVTFEINPIVTMQRDVSQLTEGDSVSVYVDFDNSNIQYKSSYTVTISDGALPDGLSMSEDGRITGTATTPGTYTFTVAVKAVDDSTLVLEIAQADLEFIMAGMNMTEAEAREALMPGGSLYSVGPLLGASVVSANETYYMTYTITVSEGTGSGDTGIEDTGKSISSMEINSNGELVVTYTDGTTQNLGKVVGSDGADGKDGEDGSGCGSVVATDMAWAAAIVIVALAAVLIVRKARKDRAGK